MARSEYIYFFQRGSIVLAAFTVKWEAYAWLRANGAKTPGFADDLQLWRMRDGGSMFRIKMPLVEEPELR